jgi:hypothetical protein
VGGFLLLGSAVDFDFYSVVYSAWSKTMVNNHQKPWSTIINKHGQTSSKTMVNNRQKPR